MKPILKGCRLPLRRWTAVAVVSLLVRPCIGRASDRFDPVHNYLDSPRFRGRDALTGLQIAPDLVRTDKVKQTYNAFVLLDRGDWSPKEPSSAQERRHR